MGRREIHSVDAEGVREVLSDLVDCLDDIGFNIPRERFQERDGNMQTFLRSIEQADPDVTWASLETSLKALADGVERNPMALKYIEMARKDLLECLTFEES